MQQELISQIHAIGTFYEQIARYFREFLKSPMLLADLQTLAKNIKPLWNKESFGDLGNLMEEEYNVIVKQAKLLVGNYYKKNYINNLDIIIGRIEMFARSVPALINFVTDARKHNGKFAQYDGEHNISKTMIAKLEDYCKCLVADEIAAIDFGV